MSSKFLLALQKVYKVNLNWFFTGEGNIFNSENEEKKYIVKDTEIEYSATPKAEIKNNEIIIHIKLDNGLVISKKNNNNPIEKDLKY